MLLRLIRNLGEKREGKGNGKGRGKGTIAPAPAWAYLGSPASRAWARRAGKSSALLWSRQDW